MTTTVHVDLIDAAGFRDDGRISIRSKYARPETGGTAFVTGAWHDFDVVDGLAEMTNLDAGPAEIWARMGSWSQRWDVTVPDDSSITFSAILDLSIEYEPAVIAQAQAARDEAISASSAASASASAAAGSAADAAATYAALTDDIANAADEVRAHIAADADRAEISATAAEASETAAGVSATDAADAAEAAMLARDDARAQAVAATGSATAAAGSASAADLSKTSAGVSATDAGASAAAAAVSAAAADGSAVAASGSAGDAASYMSSTESARDDAQYARTQARAAQTGAESARDIAVTKAGEAATSATDAAAAKTAAQTAANSFGLSVGTVTTGSPSSQASVTIIGSGPAYTLNYAIPRGQPGVPGPKGDGLKIDFTPASYGSLPAGLNNTTDVGKVAWVASNNRIYVWDGTAWPAESDGLLLAGAKGDDGRTAYEVAIANGFVGSVSEWLLSLTGSPGNDGDDGLSAYELAVANGFVGTESEWLASLHGADGATSWTELTDKPTTFPPVVGTGSADAKPGDWMPAWSDVKNKPSTFPPTIGSGSTQAVAGNDSRLADKRAPVDGSVQTVSIADGAVTAVKIATGTLPHDMTIVAFGDKTTRAVGAGDLAGGIGMQRAMTIKSIRYRFPGGADASGSTVVELRKNGVAIAGTSKSIAAADQTNAGGTAREVSGLSVAVAKGDVLTVQITAVGTTPGKSLYVDIEGVTA